MSPEDVAPAAKNRILVVDDNDKVRTQLTYVLSRSGFEVQVGKDAQEALGLLAGLKPEIVVIDLSLAGEDGCALCRRVKETQDAGDPIVVLLSSKRTIAAQVDALSAGADDYLEKPFQPKELLDLIEAKLTARNLLRHKLDKLLKLDLNKVRISEQNEKLVEYSKDLGVTRKLVRRIAESKEALEAAPLAPKVRTREGELTPEEVEQAKQERAEELRKLDEMARKLTQGDVDGKTKLDMLKRENQKKKRELDTRKKQLVDQMIHDFRFAIRHEAMVEALRKEGVPYEEYYGALYLFLAFSAKREELEGRKRSADERRLEFQEIHGIFSKTIVERDEDKYLCALIDQEMGIHAQLLGSLQKRMEQAFWRLYGEVALRYRKLRQEKKDHFWLKLFLRYGFTTADERVTPRGTIEVMARSLKKSMEEAYKAEPGDPRILYFDEYISTLHTGEPDPDCLSPGIGGLDGAVDVKEAERMARFEEKWRKVRMGLKERRELGSVLEATERALKEGEARRDEMEGKRGGGELSEDEGAALRRLKGSLKGHERDVERLKELVVAKDEEIADNRKTLAEDGLSFGERAIVEREVDNLRIRCRQCAGANSPVEVMKGISEKYLLDSRKEILEAIKAIEWRSSRICIRNVCVKYKDTGFKMRDGFVLTLGLPFLAERSVCLNGADGKEEGRVFIPLQADRSKLTLALAPGVGEMIYQSNPSFDESLVARSIEVQKKLAQAQGREWETDDRDKEKRKLALAMDPKQFQDDFRMWLSYAKSQARKKVGMEGAQAQSFEKKPINEFVKRYLNYLKKTLDAKTKVVWDYDMRLETLFDVYVV
ncbi:MAG: response regulator [Planctomycetes bacterium]|nr:response regulator [Planctomycetota bacterium]